MGHTAAEVVQPTPAPVTEVRPFIKGPAGVGLRDVEASSVSAPAR
jgi:hypothetical protein